MLPTLSNTIKSVVAAVSLPAIITAMKLVYTEEDLPTPIEDIAINNIFSGIIGMASGYTTQPSNYQISTLMAATTTVSSLGIAAYNGNINEAVSLLLPLFVTSMLSNEAGQKVGEVVANTYKNCRRMRGHARINPAGNYEVNAEEGAAIV